MNNRKVANSAPFSNLFIGPGKFHFQWGSIPKRNSFWLPRPGGPEKRRPRPNGEPRYLPIRKKPAPFLHKE
ncbi:MAG: hypothetical protein C6W57_07555 [Caldibacillus debilis]|nr:MAG: hypothetical protein C6W57_07555 [Caldibacillus debilis]